MHLTKDEMKKALLLYAVTDRRWIRDDQFFTEVVGSVLEGGATLLQLREKDLDDAAFLEEALEVQKVCTAHHVPCIVNDNVEVALKAHADGVHVGQSDIKGRDIRAMIGPDMILGITAKTVEQAKAAEAAGADYIGTGAVFGSTTKTNALAMSIDTFREIADSVHIPIVAIGGINADNVSLLKGSHADGIAVVSGIFAAPEPGAAAAELKELAAEILKKD